MIGGNLDWTELFFSSAGRLARGPFLIVAAALIGLTALFEAVVFGPWHWLFGIVSLTSHQFSGAEFPVSLTVIVGETSAVVPLTVAG